MTSCSALATKAELEAIKSKITQLQNEIGGKLEESREPVIVQTATAGAVPIALAALNPTVRAILAKVGSVLGKLAGLAAKVGTATSAVASLFSLVASLASVATVLALQARVIKLEKRNAQLEGMINSAFSLSDKARRDADTATKEANKATELANQAIAAARVTSNRANAAIKSSNSAVADANIAVGEARAARIEANVATKKANETVAKANTAIVESEVAKLQASTAKKEAAKARQENAVAVSTANSAVARVEVVEKENKSLRTQVLGFGSQIEKLVKQAVSQDNQPSLTAKQALELASTNQQNIALTKGKLKTEVAEVREEIQQERLKRELHEETAAKHLSQLELAANLEAKKNKKFKSQTQLQLERQKQILDKQGSELSKEYQSTQTKITTLERQLQDEINTRKQEDSKIRTNSGGISLANPKLKEFVDGIVDTAIGGLEDVNDKQYKDILDKIGGVPGIVGTTVVGRLAPTLGTISRNVSTITTNTLPSVISTAAAAGVCSTTQPGGCMQNNVVNPINRNINDYINAGGTAFAAANNALLLRMQGTVNTIKSATDIIKGTTQATLDLVGHAKHGLQAIQNFASTAWQASGADKIIRVVGTIASLHNAAMLSQNAALSMGDVVNNGLQLFNIKGFDGQPIDVNATVGGFIKDKLTAVFGEANLKAASETWLRLNRIHMAASSVVWSIQGTKNALLEADEITGGHVARIGNALQEQGVIEDDSYDWMNPQPDYQQPFRGILGKIDAIEDMTNRVSSVVSSGLEIKENTTELITNSQELTNATNDFLTTKNSDEAAKKEESISPEIDRLDTIKHEPAE